MKRSVVVLVALGLLAGLVGCGGSADPLSDSLSEAEAEARQWLVDITTENAKSIFEEGDNSLILRVKTIQYSNRRLPLSQLARFLSSKRHKVHRIT